MSEIHEFFNRQIKLWGGEETQDSLQDKKSSYYW